MSQDYVVFAWKNIRHRGLRSWLTIIGIIIGVAAIISLITVGQGMKNAVQEQFEKLGIRNIRIVPANLQGPPNPFFTLPNDFIERTGSVSVVDYVDVGLFETGVLEFSGEEEFVDVLGYDTALADRGFADLDISPAEGRLFRPGDSSVIILGHRVAEERFDREVSARSSVELDGRKFRVIGVFAETGAEVDNRVYIPLEDARSLFDRPNDINGLVVHLKDGIDIDEGRDAIEAELLRSFDDEDFDILTPQQILGRINTILGAVQSVVAGIAMISLLVGAVGIMNAMFTSVLERTREIGVMKATGARDSQIAWIFLAEAGIMGGIGGVVGIALGTLLAFGVEAVASSFGFPFLSIRIELPVVVAAFAISVLLGAVSGLLPALQAVRLKPVDALRYE